MTSTVRNVKIKANIPCLEAKKQGYINGYLDGEKQTTNNIIWLMCNTLMILLVITITYAKRFKRMFIIPK